MSRQRRKQGRGQGKRQQTRRVRGRGMSRQQRSCTLKVRHGDFASARAAARELDARRVYVGGEEAPGPYWCLRCGSWHVGHSKIRGADRGVVDGR